MTSGASYHIQAATANDLDAIKSLADQHKKELGFIVRGAIARSIELHEVLIAKNSCGGILGFAQYHHRRDKQTTLYNIVVESDARNQGIGRALITAMCDDARQHQQGFILLKCPLELPANAFYASLGFTKQATDAGKHRPLDIWVHQLTAKS